LASLSDGQRAGEKRGGGTEKRERERERERERDDGGRGQRRDGRGSVGDREMKAEGAWRDSGEKNERRGTECRFYVHS